MRGFKFGLNYPALLGSGVAANEVTGLTIAFKIRFFNHAKQIEAPAKLHCVRVDIVATLKLIDAIWTGNKNT